MDATLSVAAQSSSLSYSSKSVQVKTANGYAKVQEESLSVSIKTDSVSIGSGQSLADPRSKQVDLKALLASAAEDAKKSKTDGLDLTKLQQSMKDQLVEQMKQAQLALQANGQSSKLIDDILYAVDKDQEAAQVPEEWGAEQTSQRIVDFAAAFKGSAKGMSDEDFISSIRKAIQDGFRSAKGDLKELPGPSAKLFNDTYEATMKKLDDLLESWQKGAKDATGSGESQAATDESGNPTDSGNPIPELVANGQIQPAPVPASKSVGTFSVFA
jgi:hypothetical protein